MRFFSQFFVPGIKGYKSGENGLRMFNKGYSNTDYGYK